MTRAGKKEQKIRQHVASVSLEDFESLIRRYGGIIEGGRHPKAHIGIHVYPYKRKNPVKVNYVEAVLRFIDELSEG